MYTLTARAMEDARKKAFDHCLLMNRVHDSEYYEDIYDTYLEKEYQHMEEVWVNTKRTKEIYDKVYPKDESKLVGNYFVTIRPDERLIDFASFKTIVDKYLERKMIKSAFYSFEQKGESLETLGQGFHVHIIVMGTTCTSQAQLKDRTISTFKHCTAANCIEVCYIPDYQQRQNRVNYLVDYTSKKGYKIQTKIWDALWRQSVGLQDTYGICPLSSPVSGQRDTNIVEDHTVDQS